MQVSILYEGGNVIATAGQHTLFCNSIYQAVRWCDAVCYKQQPVVCIFGNGWCEHRIEYCNRCDKHPINTGVKKGG